MMAPVPAPTADKNDEKKAEAAEQQRQMAFADIVNMVANHVSDEVIINQIRSSRTAFHLTGNDILTLKQQGVSDVVIAEMQATANRYGYVYHQDPAYYSDPQTVVIVRDPPPAVVGVGFGYGRRVIGRWLI